MPRPPSWIKIKIIIWPKAVKYVPVSTTVRPVTAVADVIVNRASINLIPLPPAVAAGSINKIVPTNMAAMYEYASVWAGLIFRFTKNPFTVLRSRRNLNIRYILEKRRYIFVMKSISGNGIASGKKKSFIKRFIKKA